MIEWLGRHDPAIVDRKIARYRSAPDGSTVDDETRRADPARRRARPRAIVSGAARSEIEPVLAAVGLRDAFSLIVAMEDVARGSRSRTATCARSSCSVFDRRAAVAIEDSPPASPPRRAGLRCAALTRTFTAERLPEPICWPLVLIGR